MKNGLLLGAGFSYDLGMPLTVELTEVYLNLFTDDDAKQMARAMSVQQPYGKDRPIDPKAIRDGWNSLLTYKKSGKRNYEAFLTEIEEKAGLGSPRQQERDSYHYLFDYFYRVIHTIMDLDGLGENWAKRTVSILARTSLRRPRDFVNEEEVLCRADCGSVEAGRSGSTRG